VHEKGDCRGLLWPSLIIESKNASTLGSPYTIRIIDATKATRGP
jgi:hypothetical protein